MKEISLSLNKSVAVTVIEIDSLNITFWLHHHGINALCKFRISFHESKQEEKTVINTYFEGIDPTYAPMKVSNITDICLFVERNSEWLLESIVREHEKQHENRFKKVSIK